MSISVSELQKGITFEQFNQWKRLTGHRCQLCENPVNLNAYKMHRAVHNLDRHGGDRCQGQLWKRGRISEQSTKAGSPKYRRRVREMAGIKLNIHIPPDANPDNVSLKMIELLAHFQSRSKSF
jgi:hypothetical protein